MRFVTKGSPLCGIDGLIGVTQVLLRWTCNFSSALEVSYFWQLSLADAPLHLQILTESDSMHRDIQLTHPQGFPGEPPGFTTKPSQAKPNRPDLELVYQVSLSYPENLQGVLPFEQCILRSNKAFLIKRTGRMLPFAYSPYHECSLGVSPLTFPLC